MSPKRSEPPRDETTADPGKGLDDAEHARRIAQFSIDRAVEAIFWVGRDGLVRYANDAALRLSGFDREELLGTHASLLEPRFSETRFAAWWQQAPEHPEVLFEGLMATKTGHFIPVELTVNYVASDDREYAVVSARDVTQRKRHEEERARIEAQLRQQQKLESIGTLASGVAHEINNPINVVMNYAELVIAKADQPETVAGYAREIIDESQRIASIVSSLLDFARKEQEVDKPCRIADVVAATRSLFEDVLRKDQIALEVDVPEDLPLVRGRAKELQQVLMNLLANARDALNARYPEHDPDKRVAITAREIELSGRPVVRTTVEDRGTGIPAEVIDRVFDPFFTSKPRDRGTGLGLWVSHGIARDHGGELTVESDVGRGTRFHLDLPPNSCWSSSPPEAG